MKQTIRSLGAIAAALLLFGGGLLVGCGERKVPQGPPPEYERSELPPWPAVSAASASAAPSAAPEPRGATSGAPPAEVLSDPAPEAIDPPKGSR